MMVRLRRRLFKEMHIKIELDDRRAENLKNVFPSKVCETKQRVANTRSSHLITFTREYVKIMNKLFFFSFADQQLVFVFNRIR